MAKIITFVTQKGGSGKSTLLINLARFLVSKNKNVAIIDTDIQATASLWIYERAHDEKLKSIFLFKKYGHELRVFLEKIDNNHDYILIDTAGSDSKELRLAIGLSDIIITPTRVSQADLDTLQKLQEIISTIETIKNEKLNHKIVFNAVPNIFTKEKIESEKVVLNFGLKYMKSSIKERKIYRTSISDGKSIYEERNETAIKEFNEFAIELLGGDL